MISTAVYSGFIAATAVLMMIPGPNVALIVANSATHGPRAGLLTVLGTSAAMVPQLVLTVLGMTALMTTLAGVFEWVRWAGVAYLAWLGISYWRAPAKALDVAPRKMSRDMFWRGFVVSATNPKTLLFYGAFFPQFIDPAGDAVAQGSLLAVTFLCVALLIDSIWAIMAGRLREVLSLRPRLRQRISAIFMVAAAAGLAAIRLRT